MDKYKIMIIATIFFLPLYSLINDTIHRDFIVSVLALIVSVPVHLAVLFIIHLEFKRQKKND